MHIKITMSFFTLFLGLSSLAMAENNGYLVSDTPITVNYIICSPSKPECSKDNTPLEKAVTLNPTQKAYAVKNIPTRGFAKIISLTNNNQRSYIYSDDDDSTPCILFNNMGIKFEVYDNIILCSHQPAAVAQ